MSTFILLLLLIKTPLYHSVISINCTKSSSSCECPDKDCKLKCIGEDYCKGNGYLLQCAPNKSCFLRCEGTNACTDATFDANGATLVDIWCGGGTAPCSGSSVFNCGSGDCYIRCKGDAVDSCLGLTLNTNDAKSFECEGFGCPQSLVDLYYTAAPTTTAPSFTPTGGTTSPSFAPTGGTTSPSFTPTTLAPSTFAPSTDPPTMKTDDEGTDAPNTSKKDDNYTTIIIIACVSVVGLAAICFGIFCIYKRRESKSDDSDDSDDSDEGDEGAEGADDGNDDIDYNETTNRVSTYSVSNNTLAQTGAVTVKNRTNPIQRPQSVMNYNTNQYNPNNMTRQQSAPGQHVQSAQHMQYNINPNMMAQVAPFSNPNMTQQVAQYQVAQPPHANTMTSFPQYYGQNNPQYAQQNNRQYPQQNNMQYAMQNAQGASQMTVSSDGSDASLYEKQQQYAQEEMNKNKSTRSVLSANTDVSLYETQQQYAQTELAELHEAKEVDTFHDAQAEQVGNVQPDDRRLSATTDVSLYETQQKYLQQEMAEMNADAAGDGRARSASKRKSSRV